MGAGGLPLAPRQRYQAQLAARQMQDRRAEVAAAGGGGDGAAAAAAGGGGNQEAGPEGLPGQPLDIQASLNELVGMLQRVLDFIPTGRNSDGYDSTTSSGGET